MTLEMMFIEAFDTCLLHVTLFQLNQKKKLCRRNLLVKRNGRGRESLSFTAFKIDIKVTHHVKTANRNRKQTASISLEVFIAFIKKTNTFGGNTLHL